MSERKFFKTTFTYVVLSEDDHCENWSLEDVLQEACDGRFVGQIEKIESVELTPKETVDACYIASSDPEFFGLDSNGNCNHEQNCNCLEYTERYQIVCKYSKNGKNYRRVLSTRKTLPTKVYSEYATEFSSKNPQVSQVKILFHKLIFDNEKCIWCGDFNQTPDWAKGKIAKN